jgi:hypothetical protein
MFMDTRNEPHSIQAVINFRYNSVWKIEVLSEYHQIYLDGCLSKALLFKTFLFIGFKSSH